MGRQNIRIFGFAVAALIGVSAFGIPIADAGEQAQTPGVVENSRSHDLKVLLSNSANSVDSINRNARAESNVSLSPSKCGNCLSFKLKHKGGLIIAQSPRPRSLKDGSTIFQDGKLLLAITRPDFAFQVKPDEGKPGINATVEFAPNTVAIVENSTSGLFRAANILGHPIKITVKSGDKQQVIKVRAGEEVCFAPEFFNGDHLIPTDGVDRESIECPQAPILIKFAMSKFDQKMMMQKEQLFSCASTFEKGVGLLYFARREIFASSADVRMTKSIAELQR